MIHGVFIRAPACSSPTNSVCVFCVPIFTCVFTCVCFLSPTKQNPKHTPSREARHITVGRVHLLDVCSKRCRTDGCRKSPSFGVTGTKTADYCAQHALDGMVNVSKTKCRTEGCGKRPSFGVTGTKTTEYCAQHALDGMANVKNRKCRTEGCGKNSSFGVPGTKTAEYCAQHAPNGMVDVSKMKCRTEGCEKRPSFGVTGTKTAEYCAQHAPDGRINVFSMKCRIERCGKRGSFGVAGTETTEYCPQHAPDGMVDVCSRKCRTEGCGKKPSFGAAGTKTAEYCAQHARIQRGVEGYKDKEVGPHHSGKETIGNVVPSGAKHTTVHLPPTKTCWPSGVSRDSRKRVRHPEITSTTPKRAIARESTAGAVTMPDLNEQNLPSDGIIV